MEILADQLPPDMIYTPESNYYGTDYFIFRVSDGVNWSEPATVSITINPVNDLPLASSQNLNTNQNTDLNIVLTGTDVDGDFLTFEIVSNPTYGVLSGILPNVILYSKFKFYRLRLSSDFGFMTEPPGVQIQPG